MHSQVRLRVSRSAGRELSRIRFGLMATDLADRQDRVWCDLRNALSVHHGFQCEQ